VDMGLRGYVEQVAEGLDPNVLDMDPDAEVLTLPLSLLAILVQKYKTLTPPPSQAPPGGDVDEHNGEQEQSQDTPPQSDDEYSD